MTSKWPNFDPEVLLSLLHQNMRRDHNQIQDCRMALSPFSGNSFISSSSASSDSILLDLSLGSGSTSANNSSTSSTPSVVGDMTPPTAVSQRLEINFCPITRPLLIVPSPAEALTMIRLYDYGLLRNKLFNDDAFLESGSRSTLLTEQSPSDSSLLKAQQNQTYSDQNDNHTSPSVMEKISPARSLMKEENNNNSSSNNNNKLHCKLCSKSYNHSSALKMHIRTHTLPCQCKFCGKAFSRKWLLKGHERTHTGERPYHCEICGRSFSDRSNLRAHNQTHQMNKRYKCTQCPRSFSRMGLLNKHQASTHNHHHHHTHLMTSRVTEQSFRRNVDPVKL